MSGLTNPPIPSNLKFDANDNVLANINAQSINPNINNPYLPTSISSQTGLSVTATAANTLYNIGAAISVSRNGIAKISISGHVNGGTGAITLNLTRGGVVYVYGAIAQPLFTWSANVPSTIINTLAVTPLFASSYISSAGAYRSAYSMELNVNTSDSLQFQASNSTAAEITYIDDLEVMLQ